MIAYVKIPIYFVINYFRIFFYKIFFKYNSIVYKSFSFNGWPYIRNSGFLNFNERLKINSGERHTPIGGDTIARIIVTTNARLYIGKDVGISNSTIYCSNEITIEDGVFIGGSCKIWDTDFHSLNANIRGTEHDHGKSIPILIKNNAFIGSGSYILKGCTIGSNSIIGAGSVVTRNIPDNEIWGGNPCVFLRKV